MSFSRIHQGRVSRVEIQDAEVESGWSVIENWKGALWSHHVLFQDAVNYYSAALFAMATSDKSPLWKVRASIGEIWDDFNRKGQKRPGMRESLARSLGVDAGALSPDECFSRILKGNTSDPELLELALRGLLIDSQKGDIRNKGKENLPRFCWDQFSGSFPYNRSGSATIEGEAQIRNEIHFLETQVDREKFAEMVQLSWVAKLARGAEPTRGEDSKQRIRQSVVHLLQAFGGPASTKLSERLKGFLLSESQSEKVLRLILRSLDEMPDVESPIIPKNNKVNADKKAGLLLFKYFPSEFTARLLGFIFPLSAKSKGSKPGNKTPSVNYRDRFIDEIEPLSDDPILLARGTRGYIFPAFSSLPCLGGDGVSPVWKDFDISAFTEALKALHQIEVKTEERAKKRAELENARDAQEGRVKWKRQSEAEEEQAPALLAGDKRMERLKKLLSGSLLVRNEFTDADGVERGVSRRSLRGFEDLRERFNKIAPYGSEPTEDRCSKLEDFRKKHQAQQGDKQGDSALFEALVEPENWLLWQEIPEEVLATWKSEAKVKSNLEYAENVLRAHSNRRELDREIERAGEPIHFTPADAKYSQRQFYFSDMGEFKKKSQGHDGKSLRVTVPLLVAKGDAYELGTVRISYSAPRLLRDGLRTDEGGLLAVPFSQPMMKALGVEEELPQSIQNHAVALMPKLRRDSEIQEMNTAEEWAYLLNFPISLDTDKLQEKLGSDRFDWSSQFANYNGKNFYLRWPSLAKKVKRPKAGWWWESVNSFTFLSVDLGQREAAAFAFQEVSLEGKGRVIGDIEGDPWRVQLKEMGMLKLAGEDAFVLGKNGEWVQEPYGYRGRRQDRNRDKGVDEVAEALSIVEKLGSGFEEQLSRDYWKDLMYPVANDRLLQLLRRAQGWLARIRGWCLDLAIEDKQAGALKAVLADDRLKSHLSVARPDDAKLVQQALVSFILNYRETLCECLEIIANRILPLRVGSWEWKKHPQKSGCYLLARNSSAPQKTKRKRAGQRGLSLARISQLESLRQRIQSLNRVMRFAPDDRKSRKTLRDAEIPDPCPEILEKLDALKEQRVKQTAHLILARALGVGLRKHEIEKSIRKAKDLHGEYERFRERAADFIVVEDLSGYLSRQDKAPSENTRLMQWSHRALLDALKELCEPYGLEVVEANAAFTSKFCSRSGEVGFRARELSLAEFSGEGRYAHVDRLLTKYRSKQMSLSEDRLAELEHLESVRDLLKEAGGGKRSLFVPEKGGPMFIAFDSKRRMQADMNAAINVGLRGVAEPSRHEFYPKIGAVRKGDGLEVRAESNREKARWENSDTAVEFVDGDPNEGRAPALFYDYMSVASFGKLRVGALPVATSVGLWTTVKRGQWQVCHQINETLVKKWRGEVEEDVPFD